MADDNKPSWNMLMWVGMFAGVAFGAMLVMLFRDRRGAQPQLGGAAPINIWNVGAGGALPAAAQHQLMAPMQPQVPMMATRLQTVALSPRSNSRLWRASGKNLWNVHVSVVGPPGSFAYVATEHSALNPGFTAAANVITIPAGVSGRTIRLQPGQDLFAVSNVNGVEVSVVASEELPS